MAGTRSDGLPLNAPYPKGLTLITWTVTDSNGSSASCVQTIVVIIPDSQRKHPSSAGPEEEESTLGLHLLLAYFTVTSDDRLICRRHLTA